MSKPTRSIKMLHFLGFDFTLNIGPSRPGKVVRVVFKKWSDLSYKVVRTDLKVAKNGSDFTVIRITEITLINRNNLLITKLTLNGSEITFP
jgi:hypothetical protein